MTIVSLKTEIQNNTDLGRIELSDGSLFSFRICYLPPEASLSTTEGSEISATQEEGFRFASACLRAEKAALRLIARAEQSSFGLTRKLKRRNHETACVRAVVERLCALNLINDRRFAQLWTESRLKFSRSPRRLLSSLCARGIDRENAQAVLKIVLNEETEFEMLTRYAKRHPFKAGKKDDESESSFKNKLKNEGFSKQVINRFLDDI
jgi:regulatory protein